MIGYDKDFVVDEKVLWFQETPWIFCMKSPRMSQTPCA
jgi:hypothetical protein